MEKFLLQYGIKWVGYADPDADKKMKEIAGNLAQPK